MFLTSQATGSQDWLTFVGFPHSIASMAVPGLFLTPGESDPASAVTIVVVSGAQRLLRKLGYSVRTRGILDAATAMAIREVSGANWQSKPWEAIYGEIAESLKTPATNVSALGDITMADLKCSGNYCEGRTTAAKALLKELQAQTNRYADKAGFKAVAVDGKIGPSTTAAVKYAASYILNSYMATDSAKPVLGGAVAIPATAFTYPAEKADALAYEFRRVADLLGRPAASKPAASTGGGGGSYAAPIDTGLGIGIGTIAAVAVGGYLLFAGGGGGGGSKSKGRR